MSTSQQQQSNNAQGTSPPIRIEGPGGNHSSGRPSGVLGSGTQANNDNLGGVAPVRQGNATDANSLRNNNKSGLSSQQQLPQPGASKSQDPKSGPLAGSSRESGQGTGRPTSGSKAKIHANMGIKPNLGGPSAPFGGKQPKGALSNLGIGGPPLATLDEDMSPTKQLLNSSGQFMMGTQNVSFEHSHLLSPDNNMKPQPGGGPQFNFNQNLRNNNGDYLNLPQNKASAPNFGSGSKSSNNLQQQPHANNKISPLPMAGGDNGASKNRLTFGSLGGNSQLTGGDFDLQGGRQRPQDVPEKDTYRGGFMSTYRAEPQSLRSSFDYIDVNMNDAMQVAGENTLTGRGKGFFRKTFQEDNWSGDESVFNKQMKMPNVNLNKVDYQKEIGLNLDIGHSQGNTQKTEERVDTMKEAREMLPPTPFYKIVKKDRIQVINDYHDRWPLLELRKNLMRVRVYINRGAQLVVMHSLFETISITVIVVNSLFLAMDDPLRDPSETPVFMNIADDIFQYMYTIEMVFKILSSGFILNSGSYLRDAWNILDFTIIASGYVGMFLSGSGANLSVLRSFRVIRPLRTISSVQGLRVIVASLINAIPLLRDSILVLMFFFMIFAIAGCQLFTGAFKTRCFKEETGLIHVDGMYCGGANSCPPGYYCGKSNENPSNGATNFDNVMFSLLQVFQIVTMEGWTSLMVALMQSVGSWIIIYFYPIIFIGAFFLLNLTLAVIKAKFTEEMNNKKESAGPVKKKKVDDAQASSEDEEARARDLQDKIENIKASKQMSPRSKQNLINKIKIEHLIWKVDTVFDRKDVEHKIIERTELELEQMSKSKTNFFNKNKASMLGKSFYSNPVDKIAILQPAPKALTYAVPKPLPTTGKKNKVVPGLNYSEVFYSNKATVFTIGKDPRENLRDIFTTGGHHNQMASTMYNKQRVESPIKEDEEEHDMTGLLENERNDIQRKEMRRRMNNRRPGSGGRNYGTDYDGPLSMTQPGGKLGGVSKWLGRVFEAKKGDDDRKLVFAGIKNNNARAIVPRAPSLRNNRRVVNPQEIDEHMKRAVYENITRNFDIFEFLDENISRGEQPHQANEGDDEMSDELEFEIDDDANRLESLYFDTDLNQRRERQMMNNPANAGFLDLDDNDDESASRTNGGGEEPPRIFKRGSTQATAAEGMLNSKKNSKEQDKYQSPYMAASMNRDMSLSPTSEKHRQHQHRRRKHAIQNSNEPELEFHGRENRFMRLFRGCKQIKAKNKGRNFKEEYLMIRKRAKSQGINLNDDQTIQDEFTRQDISYKEPDTKDHLEEKSNTVRAKSIQAKRRRLLAESIRFQKRMDIMRKRRAQFFSYGVKMVGIKREDVVNDYNDYVLKKRRIKLDPSFIDETFSKKKSLYRPASTEALLRTIDVVNFDQQNPNSHGRKGTKGTKIDLRSDKSRDESAYLDSQRSQFLEQDYRNIVDNYAHREEELQRYQQHEFVPDMERIFQQKKLKVVVKMTNHEYTSINDIFEKSGPGRFMSEKEKAFLEKERKKREALKLKLPKRVPGRSLILGYQKKIFVIQKQFHEELLRNEFEASDEDQYGMLNRIEGEYNYDHRSHIFVTGTISVVVNKPHADNKIMNANYHSNIRILNQRKEEEEALKQLQEQEEKEIEKLIAEGKIKRPPKVIIKTNLDGDHHNRMAVSMNQKSLAGIVEGSAWQKIQKMNFSQNASAASMMKFMKNASRYSISMKKGTKGSVAESMNGAKKNAQPPKPEPLTDKQILRRLNQEVKRSRIFNQLNIKRLPDRIIRDKDPDKNLFKKKKKKGQIAKIEDEVFGGDDEGSADEDEEAEKAAAIQKKKKVDYFLDRPVDGSFHIGLAKDAAFQRHKDTIEWSGQDIMPRFDPYKARLAVTKLNSIRIWPYGMYGFIKKRRVFLKGFMNSGLVEHGMTLCVIGNTVVLSLDYYGADESISNFCVGANTLFTLVFACEMGLRILAIGTQKWLADRMNYMDGTIVIFSLVELIFMSGSGALSALRAVRIFRVFRVLRVARLLRGLKSMLQIINVISRSISSFIYLAMLLMLFIFIYALLGMQVFGGQFTDPEVVGTVRYNFDSFNNAFVTSFILLTTENWNTVLFYAFSSEINQFLIAIYFISCIFIGNWMLLNLFLAILLDAFTAVEEEDLMTPEKKEAIKQKMLEDLIMKQGEDFIEGMEEIQQEGFVLKAGDKKKKSKKKKKKDKTKQEAPKPVQQNILEESQDVDLEELEKRDQELLEQRKQLFRGIECEKSCYIMSKENWLRKFAYKVINHGKFETFIMILIVGSSFKLVFDTYTTNAAQDSSVVVISSYFDLIFQAFFTCEMVIKIIAFGFVMDENSYLTEAWNKLDCFIVVSGLIDTFMEGVDIPVIKILRLLRILRPLRFVSHSSSMKTLIEALMASMGSIFNVGVVIVIVFMMFAILGVNLFQGKLQSCSVDYYKINNQLECFKARGEWSTYDQNMDNVIRAMLTLFVVSNNEGWPDVMYMYVDATGVETGPKPGAGILNAYFFIFFVFVGSFFFMNLFVGVLFLNFEKAQRDEKEAMLLDGDEIKWVDMMKMICNEKAEIIKIPKDSKIRLFCFNLIKEESNFSNFIMACIILNIFTMAAIFEGMSDSYSGILEKVNYFFTGAFALECALKMIALGFSYFGSSWNKFDFFVVAASFLDIVMANMSANSLKVIRVGPQLARIMRVMRVSRLFKLLNKYKGLQALIQTIQFSMPSVINAFALLALVYFIFAVLAVFFFREIIGGDQLDPEYQNFSNFTMALMMMLRLSTGEDWPTVMYDCSRTEADGCIPGVTCGTPYAPFFYMMFVLIQQYIMVNLFILIILQQFDLYYLPDDNVLDRFKADVTNFKKVWKVRAAGYDGFKIRGTDIQKFFKELKGDLGMSNEKDQRAIERNLVIMNIQADDEGYIYFNELLYKTMKRRYAPGRTKKKILFEVELQTLEKLEKIMSKQISQSKKKERQKAVAVNPFLAMMYKNMSFNVWKDIYEKNLPKRMQHMGIGLERDISDEEEDVVEEVPEYYYHTEEDEVVDEYDKDYVEYLERREAEAADPAPYVDGEESAQPQGGRLNKQAYDQLNHEEEILYSDARASKR